MFSSKNNRSKAFTMLEILLAFAITLPILLVIARVSATISGTYWKMLDRRIATSRAASVFSILQDPLYHVGFAMLPESDFSSQFFTTIVEPFSWRCPISCPTSDKLRIIYAAPLYTLIQNNVATEDGACNINFTTAIDANQFSVSIYDIKTYVILHSTTAENKVFRIVSLASSSLRVISKTDDKYVIGKNAMVMGLRAMEATVDEGVFRTKDFRTTGVQPRINGIWAIHFELEKSKKLITVTLIASGDRECDDPRVEGKEILPSKLIEALPSLLTKTKRNLFCYKRSFFLANLGD